MASHDIFMPALSSTMTEGKIVEWLKQPGEKVSRGESVLVVESDKADMDVESFQDGFLAAVLMPSGSTVPVGETIGLIVETEAEIPAVQAANPTKSNVSPPENLSVSKDSKQTSDDSKQTPEDKPSTAEPFTSPKASSASLPAKAIINQGRIVATPRAKKLSTQLGVDLATVSGTGPHGRIQAEDVQKAQGQPITVPWIAESNAPASIPTAPSVVVTESSRNRSQPVEVPKGNSFGNPGETIPFNTLQQAVNRNMEMSLSVPCFRVGYAITTDKLDAFYKQVKPKGVTMTALLAKAVGKTLARHPQLNAAWSNEGMTYPKQINVAVAVAMEEGGLITPVLQNADLTDLFELSRQWADLVKRSRTKQLQPNEYNSGTFTLSNLGMFGVDRFDAILPPNTGGILAVAASLPKVIAGRDGSISVKRQMQVNLTADHRVVYGADGASFLKDLANLIENNPESLSS
ncbi:MULTISPECIES: dihydrolipoamide acetyltransferase family protein [Prochlorococcus]|uniref:Dihydrolipoamide acetyltransferase component of pyruvate dehydrogenase complex n=1 Tax=Prochlorococcus marinus (strain SARG / CCMP1375 / SS120) TaxID=167539 RepID=Q7VDH5_PROMA|nr:MULTISPECIES: dihydrolipoamide acetyltransferase family protein [Prochlorococcus]AAP99447.1 Dihydrolipoamide S-acetyltransferase [Prochlorococcus marinus subsp. marinus str. CCMP1375]